MEGSSSIGRAIASFTSYISNISSYMPSNVYRAALFVFGGFVFVASAAGITFFATRDPRTLAQKRSDAFNRVAAIASQKPDADFKQVGLIRVPVSENDKDALKARLIALRPGEQLEEEIPLSMALAVAKDLIKEMNLFNGQLQTDVASIGERHPASSALPANTDGDLIFELFGVIGQLTFAQQEELKSFVRLMHRVTLHSVENKMAASNIAISINDTLSPIPVVDYSVQRSPAETQAMFTMPRNIQRFTEILIENCLSIFPLELID